MASLSQLSQLDPLPSEMPFRIVSKTIGRGAYASIKRAIPLDSTEPVFAVKLIHKAYALRNGRISERQIKMEVSLHSHIGQHPNVIEWFATGEDDTWRWIAMEYAAGGDLFDKIEADVGVQEDIAHLYFQQLVGGVSFIHSKGIAHRDLKPENILLSAAGDLKIADFGLATMFEHKGARKLSTTTCGSPPYIAPEVLATAKKDRGVKYSSDLADIWSIGVILFVLLVGNTPWDEPNSQSWEFQEYLRSDGRSSDTLWERIPESALSLLRGMMSVDTTKRFSFTQIRQHPWYTRKNAMLSANGAVSDPLQLATQMLGNLHIDLKQEPNPSQRTADAMDVDMDDQRHFSSTQPEVPIADPMFDWERPTLRSMGTMAISSTQPVSRSDAAVASSGLGLGSFADEPSMSQFSQQPGNVPLSLTQNARRFHDIVPSYSLTRFFSHVPPRLLEQMLRDGLHQLNVPLAPAGAATDGAATALIRVRTVDGRKQSLHGEIVVDRFALPEGMELLEVRFVKIKGDPLEWRRFFKKVALLCKDAIYNSEA